MSRAVRQPSIREIMEAAKVLGLSPEETQKQAIPKSYWEKTGYVTMRKSASKAATLKAIAGEVVKARQKAAPVVEVKKTR
jgi:signal recognition particle subunit SEC65